MLRKSHFISSFSFLLFSVFFVNAQSPGEDCSNAVDLGIKTSPLNVDMSLYTTLDYTGSFYLPAQNDAFFYIDLSDGMSVNISLQSNDDLLNYRISKGGSCSGPDLSSSTELSMDFAFPGEPTNYTYANSSGTTERIYLISAGSGYFSPTANFSISWFVFSPPTITAIVPDNGVYNDLITITGTNFANLQAVNIGNSPVLSYTLDSPTQITAHVGLGSTGKVSVSTAYSYVESPTDFTYNYAIPTISSYLPTIAGEGSTIEINGTNFAGTTDVKFGGVSVLNFQVVSDSKITATLGEGATGEISIINSAGTGTASGFVFLNLATQTAITGTSAPNTIAPNTATVVDSTISITGNGLIKGAKVQITGGYVTGTNGDLLSYQGTLPDGISSNYDTDKGLLSFTGSANPEVWIGILKKVTLQSTNASCYPEERLITFNLGNKYYNPLTGHWYEYIADGKSWTAAKTYAASRTYFGKLGYLATVTSAAENNFIWKIMTNDAWMGGSDDFNQVNESLGRIVYPDKASVEGLFYWITGPEKGTLISTGDNNPVTATGGYANWNGGEPNDSGGDESYTQFYSGNSGTWNDLNNNNSLGTLIEYGGLANDDTSSTVFFTKQIKVLGSTTGSITGGDINVCSGNNSTNLVLVGYTGTIDSWEYSYDNFYTDGIPISNKSDTFTPTNILSTTYYRALISCGGSTIYTASTVIRVNATVSGNIIADNNTICPGGMVVFNLSGQQGNVVKWQKSTDEILWTDIANTSSTLTETIADTGTYYYRAVVQTPNCGDAVYTSNYPINVTSGTPPIGGTVTTDSYIGNDLRSGTLYLSGETGTISKWQFSVTNGLIWIDISSTANSLDYTNIAASTQYRAVVVNGSCGTAYSTVGGVLIVPIPAAPVVSNVSYCKNDTAVALSALASFGGSLNWYTLVTGGSPSAIAPVPSTSTAGSSSFYVSQTVNGAESDRAEIRVTVNETAAPAANSPQLLNANAQIKDILINGTNVLWFGSEADALAGINALDPLTPVIDGTTYYASQMVSGCRSTTATAVLINTNLATTTFSEMDLKYYPNPVTDVLKISTSNSIDSVRVLNLIGQSLIERNPNSNYTEISMKNLPAGVYIIEVKSNYQTGNFKILKN